MVPAAAMTSPLGSSRILWQAHSGQSQCIVENVPGVGDSSSPMTIYNTDVKDGLTLGVFASDIAPNHSMATARRSFSRRISPGSAAWIPTSSPAASGRGRRGIKTLPDLIAAKKTIIFGPARRVRHRDLPVVLREGARRAGQSDRRIYDRHASDHAGHARRRNRRHLRVVRILGSRRLQTGRGGRQSQCLRADHARRKVAAVRCGDADHGRRQWRRAQASGHFRVYPGAVGAPARGAPRHARRGSRGRRCVRHCLRRSRTPRRLPPPPR